jgi:hypothetical protein
VRANFIEFPAKRSFEPLFRDVAAIVEILGTRQSLHSQYYLPPVFNNLETAALDSLRH